MFIPRNFQVHNIIQVHSNVHVGLTIFHKIFPIFPTFILNILYNIAMDLNNAILLSMLLK